MLDRIADWSFISKVQKCFVRRALKRCQSSGLIFNVLNGSAGELFRLVYVCHVLNGIFL